MYFGDIAGRRDACDPENTRSAASHEISVHACGKGGEGSVTWQWSAGGKLQ